MDKPLISIIVPVYNRDKTIEVCLNSILHSYYTNIEVIVVDDGSTDKTLSICNCIAEKDRRVKVISQVNSGVSAARNFGISMSSGEWITFVDSDDAIMPNYFNSISNNMSDSSVDMIWVNHTFGRVNSNGSITVMQDKPEFSFFKKIQKRENIINWIFEEFNPYKHQFFNVWDKVFRRNILSLNNIQFDSEVSLAEDQIFVLKYLQYTHEVIFTNRPFYVSLIWDRNSRPDGLGERLRSPEEYNLVHKKNYQAFEELYCLSKCEAVKRYQINYIFDRPISRILFRYLLIRNFGKTSYSNIKESFQRDIFPIWKNEEINLNMILDSEIRYLSKMILEKGLLKSCFKILVKNNLNYYSRKFIGLLGKYF